MRLYLDVCCLNRPFDDRTQDRVRLESEAILAILQRIVDGQWRGVRSPIHDVEIGQIVDTDRRWRVELLAGLLQPVPVVSDAETRWPAIVALGFHAADAHHLSYAEAFADVFLTTDDRLERRAQRLTDRLTIPVRNPIIWLWEEATP